SDSAVSTAAERSRCASASSARSASRRLGPSSRRAASVSSAACPRVAQGATTRRPSAPTAAVTTDARPWPAATGPKSATPRGSASTYAGSASNAAEPHHSATTTTPTTPDGSSTSRYTISRQRLGVRTRSSRRRHHDGATSGGCGSAMARSSTAARRARSTRPSARAVANSSHATGIAAGSTTSSDADVASNATMTANEIVPTTRSSTPSTSAHHVRDVRQGARTAVMAVTLREVVRSADGATGRLRGGENPTCASEPTSARRTLRDRVGVDDVDDPDANFKSDVALYANVDPLRTIRNLAGNVGVPTGAVCRYVLARWATEGSGGLLELGPHMVERLWSVFADAE